MRRAGMNSDVKDSASRFSTASIRQSFPQDVGPGSERPSIYKMSRPKCVGLPLLASRTTSRISLPATSFMSSQWPTNVADRSTGPGAVRPEEDRPRPPGRGQRPAVPLVQETKEGAWAYDGRREQR